MADKTIDELIAATMVSPDTLFLIQQAQVAKKLEASVLQTWLTQLAGGLGSINSIKKISTQGLADTYQISFTYGATQNYVVYNGRGISTIEKVSTVGLADNYRITYSDGTTSSFVITNGEKGNKGDAGHVWIKYASQKPTAESHSIGDLPDAWIGIYSGTAAYAPTNWEAYTWYQWKGVSGNPGDPGPRGFSIFYSTKVHADNPVLSVDYYIDPAYVQTNSVILTAGDFILDPAGHLYIIKTAPSDVSRYIGARYLTSLMGPPGTNGISYTGGISYFHTSATQSTVSDGRPYTFQASSLDVGDKIPKVGDIIIDSEFKLYLITAFDGVAATTEWIATWSREPEPILPEYFDYVVLKSTESNKRFKVQVNDAGVLTAEQLVIPGTITFDDYMSWGVFSGVLTFEIGMTWADFCNSSYNTQNFRCEDDHVLEPSGCYVQYKLSNVAYTAARPKDAIVNGRTYYWDMM